MDRILLNLFKLAFFPEEAIYRKLIRKSIAEDIGERLRLKDILALYYPKMKELEKESSDLLEELILLKIAGRFNPEALERIVGHFSKGEVREGATALGRSTGRYIPKEEIRRLSYLYRTGTFPEYRSQLFRHLPEELKAEILKRY